MTSIIKLVFQLWMFRHRKHSIQHSSCVFNFKIWILVKKLTIFRFSINNKYRASTHYIHVKKKINRTHDNHGLNSNQTGDFCALQLLKTSCPLVEMVKIVIWRLQYLLIFGYGRNKGFQFHLNLTCDNTATLPPKYFAISPSKNFFATPPPQTNWHSTPQLFCHSTPQNFATLTPLKFLPPDLQKFWSPKST